ncbi:Alpha/beta hydrolase fold-1 [Lentinula aciculospora]|uniref:Alpha/beta hydrolase fold-1 n=1 Tax=Lentinula aciculospora TaxID=153920 RepID=A0A9W8ZX17_9AGAR|nr:Alpha/beta hydrolase fold-1 [Lentinula aciculospora]
MSTIQREKVVIDTPPVEGLPSLKMVTNHYTRTTSARMHPSYGDVALVFMHGLGQTKEQWEPVLTKLWDEVEGNKDLSRCYTISEAWTPEWQSHGESAILNKSVFARDNIQGISVSVWATGLAALFTQGYLKNKKVIAVGFSIGNLAILNGFRPFLSSGKPPVIGLIVVEPLMFDRETSSPDHPKSNVMVKLMKKGIQSQAENWSDREAARQYLTKQLPWSQWERSVLESYLQYGLEDSTDATGKPVVKLICSRAEEASTYGRYLESWDALSMLEQLCSSIPIHVVFGSKDRLIPREWKASVVDASKGRKVAGVHQIQASHMVPAEKPEDFARLVSQLIQDIVCNPLSKL